MRLPAVVAVVVSSGLASSTPLPAVPASAPPAVYYGEVAPPPGPTRLAAQRRVPPLVELPPAAEVAQEELAALARYNREQLAGSVGPRLRHGFLRSLGSHPVAIDLARPPVAEQLRGGALTSPSRRGSSATWSASVAVQGAAALRLGLSQVSLPRGSRLWIYGAEEPALGPFGRELVAPDGTLWLPPYPGPEIFLEVEVPAGAGARGELRFDLDRVIELVEPAALEAAALEPKVWTDCDIDGTCVGSGTLSTIAGYRDAVARLSFVDGVNSYLCSGALVNDTDPSGFRPFLLTANHCFDSQASASSLVAYFDYRTAACNGAPPSLASVPQVSGATLLASNPASDFTLVELSANPSGTNTFLGWTTATPAHGQTLYRLSHPSGQPQKYSTQSFQSSGGVVCSGTPRPHFHYSGAVTGSTAGGSSGAPVVDAGLHIVGQLYGVCHFASWDDCSYGTYSYIDGAFATTYSYVSSWLNPSTPGCVDDAFEPDDVCYGPQIAVGGSQVHKHCDEDWVYFEALAGATYRIETSALIGGADTTLALHAGCGPQLVFDDDGAGGLASRIDFLSTANQFLDVRIRQYADSYANGEGYTISVSCLANCAGSSIFADGFESGSLAAWSSVSP